MVVIPPTDAELYAPVDGPLLSLPIEGDAYSGARVLVSQTVHELPMSGGLGQHLEGHRPAETEAFLASNAFLQILMRLESGESGLERLEPEAIDAVLERGWRYVVADPSSFFHSLADRRAASYARVFRSIWGEPIHVAGGGGVWRIEPIEEPVLVQYGLVARPDRSLR